VIRIAVGLAGALLLAAGVLSGWSLGHDIDPAATGLQDRRLHMAWFPVAIGLGVWFLSGFALRWAWWAAIGTFLLLGSIAVILAVQGANHCGCFGAVRIPPWITVAIDAGMVVMLALVRWRSGPPVTRPIQRGLPILVASLAAVVAVPLLWRALAFVPARFDPAGAIVGEAPVVVCDPPAWIDSRFPLLNHIEATTAPLDRGIWTLVVVRRGCPACQEHLDAFGVRFAARAPSGWAILDVPDGEATPLVIPAALLSWPVARLHARRRWAMATPATLQLRDGVVTALGEAVSEPTQQVPIAASATVAAIVTTEPPAEIAVIHAQAGSWDLGWVAPRSQSSYRLAVTVPSGVPTWRITQVISDCACMTAMAPSAAIAAGAQVEIPLLFAAGPKAETYAKNLTVVWSDPALAPLTIPVLVTIGLPLVPSPRKLVVPTSVAEQGGTVSVRLTNHGTVPIRVLYATSDQSGVMATVLREPIPARGSADLEVRIAPGLGKPAILTVATGDELQPSVTIPIVAATASAGH
jgi:hypothetical protein